MKNFRILSFLLIVATSLLLVNCTTEPIPGPDGKDGIDGIDGVDGVSGTAECAACHNVAKSEEVHASYLFSGHYNENMTHEVDDELVPLSQYANRGYTPNGPLSCVMCHTSDGYKDIVETGSAPFGNFGPDNGGYPLYEGTQTITCTTCHNKHTSFDFETDGKDYALRVVNPVDLLVDNYTIDYGKDNLGNHTCATCHQPRSVFPDPEEDGKIEVGSRFGPHYGAQSTLLEGIHGAEIAGSLTYDQPKTAAHRAGSSCTSCHMGASGGNNLGLHTKKPNTATSCTPCHADGAPPSDFLAEDIETLKNLLIAEGLLTESGSPVAGFYDLIPASALWNYRMIYYDHSKGLHNPKYAKALVRNSIEALNAN